MVNALALSHLYYPYRTMQDANLHFSPHQIKLISNADWILTKNALLLQLNDLLEELRQRQQALVAFGRLPEAVRAQGSKISRGERHEGLPWIILDHPRCFTREDIFAIRTLFWWGRIFSTTLHLSGRWQQWAAPALAAALPQLQATGFTLSASGNQWAHDSSSDHYTSLKDYSRKSFESLLQNAAFIKISGYHPIERINEAPGLLMQQFQLLISVLDNRTSNT
ncbi:hypothetical protein GCM10027051_21100 [Niabella terrae]